MSLFVAATACRSFHFHAFDKVRLPKRCWYWQAKCASILDFSLFDDKNSGKIFSKVSSVYVDYSRTTITSWNNSCSPASLRVGYLRYFDAVRAYSANLPRPARSSTRAFSLKRVSRKSDTMILPKRGLIFICSAIAKFHHKSSHLFLCYR